MKYSQIAGIIAAIVLILSGFFNWAWYPDIQKYFTGFFSENNSYGRPGKVFIFFAGLAIVLFIVPRVWAKRGNLFLCAIILAYAIKTYIVYSACYRGICPQKQPALFVMVGAAVLMMAAAMFPDLAVKDKPSTPST